MQFIKSSESYLSAAAEHIKWSISKPAPEQDLTAENRKNLIANQALLRTVASSEITFSSCAAGAKKPDVTVS